MITINIQTYGRYQNSTVHAQQIRVETALYMLSAAQDANGVFPRGMESVGKVRVPLLNQLRRGVYDHD